MQQFNDTDSRKREQVYTQATVPLLSRVVISQEELDNPKRLAFLIKLNNGLSIMPMFQDEQINSDFQSFIKEEPLNYKPLVIVGPSGAGKVR